MYRSSYGIKSVKCLKSNCDFVCRQALATGIAYTGAGLGLTLIPIAYDAIIRKYGAQGIFTFNLCLAITVTPFLAYIYPTVKNIQERQAAIDAAKAAALANTEKEVDEEASNSQKQSSQYDVIKSPLFWMFGAAILCSSCSHTTAAFFIPKIGEVSTKRFQLTRE